jgi:archaellum component FlaC
MRKMEDKILLEMQQQLGRIEASITAVKEDISELKQKDQTQSENLEKAYAKAKARQDSIRDDLQHQIDGQKTLILTVNESINSLNKNIESMFKEYKKDINERIDGLENRIIEVETRKEKTLVKWYDKIADKIVNAFLIAGGAVLLKWLNVPHEVVGQFSK